MHIQHVFYYFSDALSEKVTGIPRMFSSQCSLNSRRPYKVTAFPAVLPVAKQDFRISCHPSVPRHDATSDVRIIPATRVSVPSFPSIWYRLPLFLQSGPFDDCNLLTVIDKNSSRRCFSLRLTVKMAVAIPPSSFSTYGLRQPWNVVVVDG